MAIAIFNFYFQLNRKSVVVIKLRNIIRVNFQVSAACPILWMVKMSKVPLFFFKKDPIRQQKS